MIKLYQPFLAYAAVRRALPWSLLRFGFLGLVGLVTHKVAMSILGTRLLHVASECRACHVMAFHNTLTLLTSIDYALSA